MNFLLLFEKELPTVQFKLTEVTVFTFVQKLILRPNSLQNLVFITYRRIAFENSPFVKTKEN